jgi:nucleoside-diphosphate-sugar epimerase
MMSGKKILVTGATGQVAGPIAWELAKTNEVWALGRFGDPQSAAGLEARGIKTHRWDMGAEPIAGLADDFTHVLHAAYLRDTNDFEAAMHVNTVGTGMLMSHCRNAEAFLFLSGFAVYKLLGNDHHYAETDPLGGETDWMPPYGPSKLATEGVVRAFAEVLGLPSVIARLNTSYGPSGHGGVPVRFYRLMLAGETIAVPKGGEVNLQSPIHTDDMARQLPLLWDRASTTPLIVNWAGDQAVSVNDMMTCVSELTGVPVKFEPSDVIRQGFASDNTLRKSLIGDCSVPLRQGLAQTLEAMFPGSLKNA